ncbi:hypothetical protein EDB19DRAFT_1826689 [Suillus lakei]|nr:hypothetical protein EDB19DRAFT_1826689 [Suillus lakei]
MPPSLNPDQEASVWPKWVPVPSKGLTDASNSTTPELSTHLEAIAFNSHSVTPAKRSQNTDSSGSGDDTDCAVVPKPPKKKKLHHSQSVIISSNSEDSHATPAKVKKNQGRF